MTALNIISLSTKDYSFEHTRSITRKDSSNPSLGLRGIYFILGLPQPFRELLTQSFTFEMPPFLTASLTHMTEEPPSPPCRWVPRSRQSLTPLPFQDAVLLHQLSQRRKAFSPGLYELAHGGRSANHFSSIVTTVYYFSTSLKEN